METFSVYFWQKSQLHFSPSSLLIKNAQTIHFKNPYSLFFIIIMQSDFQRQLLEGVFRTRKDFISNDQNLQRIIHYIHKASPTAQCLGIIFNLIKFFRFPLALCCAPYYHTISTAQVKVIQELKEMLMDMAAYIKSLIKEMGIDMFPQIEFFFKYGHAGKRYKINIVQQEKNFAMFIREMSGLKKELEGLSKVGFTEEADEKIKQFLGMELEKPNVFQRSSVEYMKSSCGKIINSLLDHQVQQPSKRYKKQETSMEESNVSRPYKGKSTVVKNQSLDESNVSSDESFQNGTSNASYSIKPICCRTWFQKDEVIDQPQSLRIQYKFYNFPFISHPDQTPSKQQKIKKTICGFLNGQGGIIYFGIKEQNQTKKRVVWGMILSQQRKKDFNAKILKLIGEVLPDVGKKFAIKYIPIKNQKGNYINGSYVAKLVIERGDKANVYSYQTTRSDGAKVEKFAFRTENEVLEISEIQRVLKIFRNKVESPERTFYPTHPGQCPEPELGKPLYDHDDYDSDSEEEGKSTQKKQKIEPIFNQQNQKLDFPTWQEQEQYKKRKKYLERESGEVLIHEDKQNIDSVLYRLGIRTSFSAPVDEHDQWNYLQLQKPSDFTKLSSTFRNEVIKAFPRLCFRTLQKDQLPLLDSVIDTFAHQQSWKITQDNKQEILYFRSTINACKFYLKMLELGMKIPFSP